jgi:hypothetical protein
MGAIDTVDTTRSRDVVRHAARDGRVVPRVGTADTESPTRALEGVVMAVDGHRERLAKVLGQLEDLQRQAVPWHPGSRTSERATTALFALFAQRLRTADDALREVVLQLRERVG